MRLSDVKSLLFNWETGIHLLLWMLFFSAVNVSWTENWFDPTIRPHTPAPLSALVFPAFFYLNAAWLIPRFFRGKSWYRYFLVVGLAVFLPELLRALLYVLQVSADVFWDALAGEMMGRDSLLFSTPSPVGYGFLLSSAYRFTKDRVLHTRRLEQLEKEKLAHELQLLKAQIDPHFLFNNLNALDDLIGRDTRRAQEYVHRLASLYRYAITSASQDVVSLREEWQWMDDYIYLLEARFGAAYRFESVNELGDLDRYLIPPAALQTLIENVVKHNQGNPDTPLKTTIHAGKNGICISHARKPKAVGADSLGTGLKNLAARYRLLSDHAIQIETGEMFSVTLPLLTPLP